MANIEIYTTTYCPHCVRAKNLFQDLGQTYTEIDVTEDQAARVKLVEMSGGRRTVPQIFINGQHIGGADDLYLLHKSGGLQPLLV